MKRILASLTALTLFCALTACSWVADQSAPGPSPSDQEEPLSENGTSSTPDEQEPAAAAEPRVLVAYFSATANTEHIARHIQTVLNADLYEIVPEEPYTDDDLHYSDDNCRANREQNDPDARPAITGTLEHPENYDAVFLGYPIWWGQAPFWKAIPSKTPPSCPSAPPAPAASVPVPTSFTPLLLMPAGCQGSGLTAAHLKRT